jgi:hypothetical protein
MWSASHDSHSRACQPLLLCPALEMTGLACQVIEDDRRNDQVLDAAKFKQGDGANEAGFVGIAPKNCWK